MFNSVVNPTKPKFPFRVYEVSKISNRVLFDPITLYIMGCVDDIGGLDLGMLTS